MVAKKTRSIKARGGKGVDPPSQVKAASRSRSSWAAPAIVFAAAAAVRLLHVQELADSPFDTVRMGDAVSYHQWAGRIASGDWFGEGVFYQAPLYPYFLAAIYALLGPSLVVVRICQALVGSVACGLLTRAAELEFGRTAGLSAGLLLAFDGDAVFLGGLVQKSVLDALLVCAVILQLLLLRQRPGWPRALALGVVLGLLALSRENALVWLPVLILWLATRPSQRRACVAGLVAGTILVLAPVAVRNRIAGGNWELTTAQSGPNLYIGNSALATGTYVPLRPGRQIPAYEQRDATDLAEQAVGRRLSPSEVSDYWASAALGWIREHPAAWLRLIGLKIVLLVNARGASDTEDIATHAEHSRTLQFTRHIVSFGALVPLAAIALWVLRARLRELWVLPAMIVTYGASVIAFFVLDRYRFPLVPLLCLLAGAGLAAIKRWWSTSTARDRTGAALVTLTTAIACYWPIALVDEAQMRAVTAFNLGVAFQQQGRLDGAAEQYEQAIAIQPDDAEAQSNLGIVLAAKGDHAAALARYREALRIDPTYPTALNNVATELGALGRHSDALAYLRQAVATSPMSSVAHYNLATALARTGQPDEALVEFRQAVALDPANAAAHNNAGSLLATLGRLEEAQAEFREALRIRPGFAEARANLDYAIELSRTRRTPGVR